MHPARGVVLLLLATVVCAGCGELIDKDNIVVARIGEDTITRGELNAHIRDAMGAIRDEMAGERMSIRTKADKLGVLNRLVDQEIKSREAERLEAEGLIQARRDLATAIYFEEHPENRFAYEMKSVEGTDFTQEQLNAMQAAIDFEIDDEQEVLLQEEAVKYLMQRGVQAGTLTITDEEFQREFELLQILDQTDESIRDLPAIEFYGIRFPAASADAIAQAGEVYRRVTSGGESFEAVFNEFARQDPQLVMSSGLENNPAVPRFKRFWERVSENPEPGDIIGPVLLPQHQMMGPGPDGRPVAMIAPAAHVVLQVDKFTPGRPKTWEEARPFLAGRILERKVIDQLRAEYAVEIYADKVDDPGTG